MKRESFRHDKVEYCGTLLHKKVLRIKTMNPRFRDPATKKVLDKIEVFDEDLKLELGTWTAIRPSKGSSAATTRLTPIFTN